ncbi:MAG: zinc ribbon domain-containing protein [Nitrospirae bacterium]|nr:zinc ribbon domain-containing protein [Nitrospirota bacterium]
MLICPHCNKKYRSPILVCPKCGRELLPPSAIKLRTEHPGLSKGTASPKPKPPKKTAAAPREEAHIEVLRGRLNEMKEAARFLEKEGIRCRIEHDELLLFQYRLDEEDRPSDLDGVVVRAPLSQVEKARALLDWEAQKDALNKEEDRFLAEDEEATIVCAACDSEVAPEDEICPECGRELDLDDEADEEEYFCSSCGEACDPDDPVCPSCGAHFDH